MESIQEMNIRINCFYSVLSLLLFPVLQFYSALLESFNHHPMIIYLYTPIDIDVH